MDSAALFMFLDCNDIKDTKNKFAYVTFKKLIFILVCGSWLRGQNYIWKAYIYALYVNSYVNVYIFKTKIQNSKFTMEIINDHKNENWVHLVQIFEFT